MCFNVESSRESNRSHGLAVMQRFLSDLPKARLELIKDSGHLPHVEKKEEFASILRDFYLQANGPAVEVIAQQEDSQSL